MGKNVKFNSDGVWKEACTHAGCGGFLRGSDDRWIKGCVRKIGMCDAFHTEMWDMYLGLNVAWRENITHLIVESDSNFFVDMINDNCKFNGIIATLVRRIRKLLSLSWTV
jgi:ribonuclease HI